MNVLITGANGQLGRALQATAPGNANAVALDRRQLDITDAQAVKAAVADARVNIIINAAAYTAVDRAESEPEQACAVNATGPENLARAALENNARLIHVSTDFVFDGTSSLPYGPHDEPNPLGTYGRTKLEGERKIAASGLRNYLVLRSAWIYAAQGKNFLLTMLRAMNERDEIHVVCDQTGTPTWALSLARVIWKAAANEVLRGIYHWSDAGVATWYDFAIAIQEEAIQRGLLNKAAAIRPIRTAQYPTPAVRPPFSVFDKTNTYADFGVDPVHWRVNLRSAITEIADA